VELVEAENSCELSRTGVARLVMSTDALAATLVRVREGAKMAGRQASFSPSRAPRSAIPPSDALALSLVCGSDGCVVLVELLGTM
jgi:hypothetical protein